MGQVVPIAPNELDSLAADINEAIAEAFDSLLVVCVKLARAKEVCREQGITFKSWFPGRIALSPNLVYSYARIGEAKNPNQALAEYRLARLQSVERARKKVSLRSDTPLAKIAAIDDDPDGPGYDPMLSENRIENFINWCTNIGTMGAQYDDFSDLQASKEDLQRMIDAAEEAARAYTNAGRLLQDKLEGESDD